MAFKTIKRVAIACGLLICAGNMIGQPKSAGAFSIDVKKTAAQQFDYASRLTTASTGASDWEESVIRSVAALDVIPRRWPKERKLIDKSYHEIVARLNDAHLHKNALIYCDRAISFLGAEPERLVFVAARARALMWLGNKEDARLAFEAATASTDFVRLDNFEKRSILLDKSFFEERNGDYRLAAVSSRERAKYGADEFQRVEAYRKAVDLSLQAGDFQNANNNINELVDAAQKARMRNLKPEEQDFLRRVDAAVVDYKKKLRKP